MNGRLARSSRAIAFTAVAILVAAILTTSASCTSSQAEPARRKPHVTVRNDASSSSEPITTGIPVGHTDACAAHLHDLAGTFLLYYAARHELPPTIEALAQVQPIDPAELSCPVSRRPYVYNPAGVLAPGNNGRAILYDASPVHNGMRYALTIVEPQGDAALVAKVIAIPEAYFAAAAQQLPEPARPPQRAPEER